MFAKAQLYVVQLLPMLLLFLLVMTALYHLLLSAALWRNHVVFLRLPGISSRHPFIRTGIRIMRIKAEAIELKKQLLLGCGLKLDAAVYEVFRRTGIAMLCGLCLISYKVFAYPLLSFMIHPAYVLAGSACGLTFLVFDMPLLALIKQYRSRQVITELCELSRQLLYYSHSQMSLHAKLSRCSARMQWIRPELQRLLNEWYYDAERAIARFKERLGVDEAYSFGETLNALRLNEDQRYYELLRQRIQDYKQKLELHRESRRETVSYLLFILAGLPILNTFRVFMYPWIMEGKQLFESIHS